MTEPLVDLRGLLRGLHENHVEYVVFGALAMVFYGFVRNTEDFDIVVAPDRENLDRVAEWLMSIEAVLKLNPKRRFGPRERWGIHKGSNATVLTRLGQVDVVQRIEGMPDWEELVAQAAGSPARRLGLRGGPAQGSRGVLRPARRLPVRGGRGADAQARRPAESACFALA